MEIGYVLVESDFLIMLLTKLLLQKMRTLDIEDAIHFLFMLNLTTKIKF